MKVFAENRKARNSYEFQEFYEAGIVLTGPETKSVRTGAVSIIDAFAIIENEEAFLMEMNIEPYNRDKDQGTWKHIKAIHDASRIKMDEHGKSRNTKRGNNQLREGNMEVDSLSLIHI